MRRPRFNLRVALVVTRLAAIVSGVYWHGWERLMRYRAQQAFLAEVGELRRGELISRYWHPAFKQQPRPLITSSGGYDAKGKYSKHVAHQWPDAVYVIFWRYEDSYSTSVEVFWLAPSPKQYTPQTPRAKRELARRADLIANPGPGRIWRGVESPSQLAYRLDFVEMISGDRSDNMGFDYELIYSDPPQHAEKEWQDAAGNCPNARPVTAPPPSLAVPP